jgi:hypothetical protein
MIVILHWLQGDDTTWLEAAWDVDTTIENPDGYQEENERIRKLAYANGYLHRVQRVKVPGVFQLFEAGQATAEPDT